MTRATHCFLALASLLLLAGCRQPAATPPAGPGVATLLQQLLDDRVAHGHTPGAILLVRTPSFSWVGASGWANLSRRRPMKPDDHCRVASITKVFVATVVLRLAEEGRLRLDDRLARYLPADLLNPVANAPQVTLRQLLSMSSGIPDYIDTDAYQQAVEAETHPAPWKPQELIHLVDGESAEFAPGEDQDYANINYLFLQLVIEQVTGHPLAAEIRRVVLTPLGLKDTWLEWAEPRSGGYHGLEVRGYEDQRDVTLQNNALGLADGGLISNAPDLAAFLDALLQRRTLLTPESLRQMLTFDPADNYGLGLDRGATVWGPMWGHSGGQSGFGCDMRYLPDQHTLFVLLTNRTDTHLFNALFEPAMKLALPYVKVPADGGYQVLARFGTDGSGDGEFAGPCGLALDPRGYLYVADYHNHRIQVFDPDGRWRFAFGSPGSAAGQFAGPAGLAIDAAGNVYVADHNNDRIQKFTGTGRYLTAWGSPGTGDGRFTGPRGVAVDAQSNVYVIDDEGHRVQKYTADGRFLASWGGLATPRGIGVDDAGNVSVLDVRRGPGMELAAARVLRFDASGRLLGQWGSVGDGPGQFAWPVDLAVGPHGDVYVCDGGHHRIDRFDPTGRLRDSWRGQDVGGGWFGYPQAVAPTATGPVYVADSVNNSIEKLLPRKPDIPH